MLDGFIDDLGMEPQPVSDLERHVKFLSESAGLVDLLHQLKKEFLKMFLLALAVLVIICGAAIPHTSPASRRPGAHPFRGEIEAV